MNKHIGDIYSTTDYYTFTHICGNRDEIESRVKKIEKSVAAVGYIPAPIIINEKREIIDGQARYEYCKRTGTPIAYTIVEGLSIDDCIAMNINSTNWGIMDYINSYANRGFESYVKLKQFIAESPYSLMPTIWALVNSDLRNVSESIKQGTLDVDQNDYERGKEILLFWHLFDDISTNRKKEFLVALGYCYLLPCVDNVTLINKLHHRPRDFKTIATVTDAITVIESAYNVRARNHVYIETEYYKYLDSISKGLGQTIITKRMKKI
jgi:hypothetical protein